MTISEEICSDKIGILWKKEPIKESDQGAGDTDLRKSVSVLLHRPIFAKMGIQLAGGVNCIS